MGHTIDDLPTFCYVAVALHAVSCLLLAGMMAIVLVFIFKQGRGELERIAKIIPNSKTALEYARISPQVLSLLADKTGLGLEQLCEIYGRDYYGLSRQELVTRTFGEGPLIDNFMRYSDFVPEEE